MRWLTFLIAVALNAQTYHADPDKIIQGEVIKVAADSAAVRARLDDKTIPLFAEADGSKSGMMPVPVLTKPGIYSLQFLDDKDAVISKLPVTVLDAHYERENIAIAPAIAALPPSPGEQKTVAEFEKIISDQRYWNLPFQAPVPGCITSPFGSLRMHNGKLTGSFHAGIDQRGASGTPIHPIAAGVVKLVEKYNLRGGTVAVDHGQGVESIYLHMSNFAAKVGQQVTPNDVIGYVGSTGRSTGPHVHWTLLVHGEAMNPSQWISLHACTAEKPAIKKVSATKQ